jgi:pyruvate decarboxylase
MEPNMDQDIYIGMSAPIRKTHTKLSNPATMAQEIDRVIEEGVKSRLPVFIYVPLDIVGIPLDATRLETPLNTTITNNKQQEDEIVNSALELIKGSSKPAILADVLTIRHGGRDLTRRLVSATHFPSYSTPLSKGVIDESSPNYNGVYNGEGKMHLAYLFQYTKRRQYSFVPRLRRISRKLRSDSKRWSSVVRLQHWWFLKTYQR